MAEIRSPRPRSAQVDFMRAIAIMAVAVIHTWGGATEVVDERGPEQAALFAAFVSGSVWAVPMFFFLSGFVLTHFGDPNHWRGPLHWWRRRAVRLLPPYVFWSVVCLVAWGERDVGQALLKLATGTASYQMYFVVALVQVYVLWSLVMPWLRRQGRRAQGAVLLGAFGFSVLVHVFRAYSLSVSDVDGCPWLRATLLPWVGYFALGCLAALRRPDADGPLICLPTSRPLGLVCGLVALASLSGMVLLRVTYTGPHGDDPLSTPLKPVYAVCMVWLFAAAGAAWERSGSKGGRLVSALARDAYGIYLSHVLVMALLSDVIFFEGTVLSFAAEVPYRILAWAAVLGVSWGAVRVLSLVPGVKAVSGAERG